MLATRLRNLSNNTNLKGEELSIKTSKNGIVVLGYLGVSLGFGKASDNKVKNYYPKGLRKSL